MKIMMTSHKQLQELCRPIQYLLNDSHSERCVVIKSDEIRVMDTVHFIPSEIITELGLNELCERILSEFNEVVKRTFIKDGIPSKVVFDNGEEFVQTSEGKATETDDVSKAQCNHPQCDFCHFEEWKKSFMEATSLIKNNFNHLPSK